VHVSIAERVSALKEILAGTRRGRTVTQMYAERRNRVFAKEPRVLFSAAAAGFPVDDCVLAAVREFEKRGYEVRTYNCEGTTYYEIDRVLLAEAEKMRALGAEVLRLIDMHETSDCVLRLFARQ